MRLFDAGHSDLAESAAGDAARGGRAVEQVLQPARGDLQAAAGLHRGLRERHLGLHISLYMLPPVPLVPLLNTCFMWFDRWIPLFGAISVGSYLLACAVKGCFKLGMHCCCFSLHPLKLSGTCMNSMLFNLGLVLLCSILVVQFYDQAFQDYGRLTSIRTMMGNQIYHLQGMSFFWEHNLFVSRSWRLRCVGRSTVAAVRTLGQAIQEELLRRLLLLLLVSLGHTQRRARLQL